MTGRQMCYWIEREKLKALSETKRNCIKCVLTMEERQGKARGCTDLNKVTRQLCLLLKKVFWQMSCNLSFWGVVWVGAKHHLIFFCHRFLQGHHVVNLGQGPEWVRRPRLSSAKVETTVVSPLDSSCEVNHLLSFSNDLRGSSITSPILFSAAICPRLQETIRRKEKGDQSEQEGSFCFLSVPSYQDTLESQGWFKKVMRLWLSCPAKKSYLVTLK